MSEFDFTLPSFAKINWTLRILGKRSDGYHELCTIFQTVSLSDEISFAQSDEITLSCDVQGIPCDDHNLIVKAAKMLRLETGTDRGARIHLSKKIPAPGGLGGGSSNAATALLGLATLWELDVGFSALMRMGSALGADVPFFLYGGTALGSGRGTSITPLADHNEKWILIVTPPVDVPTAEAFANVKTSHLTSSDSNRILKICQNEAERFERGQKQYKNDFETSVFACQPEIGAVKQRLIELGANQAVLSGSGASVFATFDNEETRQATQNALLDEGSWRQFAVATVSSDEFRAAFHKCRRLFPISF